MFVTISAGRHLRTLTLLLSCIRPRPRPRTRTRTRTAQGTSHTHAHAHAPCPSTDREGTNRRDALCGRLDARSPASDGVPGENNTFAGTVFLWEAQKKEAKPRGAGDAAAAVAVDAGSPPHLLADARLLPRSSVRSSPRERPAAGSALSHIHPTGGI